MSAVSSNPSTYREDALNALIEIRACHDELRTFLTEAFDRLDDVVNRIRNPEAAARKVAPKDAERPLDRDMMQDQIDYLTRLVTDLAHTVNDRESTPAEQNGAKP